MNNTNNIYNHFLNELGRVKNECILFKAMSRSNNLKNDNMYDTLKQGGTFYENIELSRFYNDDWVCDRLRLMTKKSVDNTILISAIVNKKDSDHIKYELKQLGQLYADMTWNADLHIELLETPLGNANLLNLFITNNMQPQLLFLGTDCYAEFKSFLKEHYYSDNTSKNIKVDELNKIYYFWQEDPIPTYEKQLVNLGNPEDLELVETKIKQLFDQEAKKMIWSVTHNQTHWDNEFETSKEYNSINYLDLPWIMSNIKNRTVFDDVQRDSIEIPCFDKITEKLAENL